MTDRATILEAAGALCVEEGFAGFTMRRLGQSLGVTAPALYKHFPSKAALIGELLEEAREAFGESLALAAEGATPLERFALARDAYLDFALQRPRAYELLFMSPNQLGLFRAPNALQHWRDTPSPSFQVCVDVVTECMHAGVFRSGDPTSIALTLSGLAHGLVSLWLVGRFGQDEAAFRVLYQHSIDQLLEGLVAREDGP